MVPVGGLEPPRPKATDFESVVYTNFTTPASLGLHPFDGWHYTELGLVRNKKITIFVSFADNFTITVTKQTKSEI